MSILFANIFSCVFVHFSPRDNPSKNIVFKNFIYIHYKLYCVAFEEAGFKNFPGIASMQKGL